MEIALMANETNSDEDAESSYDSWAETSYDSGDSWPFDDVVRSSSGDDEDEYCEGKFILERVESDYESSDDFDSVTSLDPLPASHRLNDLDLQERIFQGYEWSDSDRIYYVQ